MRKIFCYSLLLILFACGSNKKVNDTEDMTPDWVKNYPVTENYFTGI